MKAIAVLILSGLVLGINTTAMAKDECLEPGNDELLKQGCAALDTFIAAFNAKDAKAWAKTVHYPHVRLAGGQLQIWNTPEEYAESNDARQLEKSSGWARSGWTQRTLVQRGDDKLHFTTQFARYDANGKVMLTADSLYVLVKKDGRWGAQMRSSYVGVAGRKTAF